MYLRLPAAVELVEVGLRDGLQSLPEPVPTAHKVELVRRLLDCGFKTIEAVSFAHPRVLPQMADAEQVLALVPRVQGVTYRGLVPNARGARRAVAAGVDEMVGLIACDEAISQINQNLSRAQAFQQLDEVLEIGAANGVPVVVGVVVAFFAPGAGVTPVDTLRAVVSRLWEMGVRRLYLAATSGMADPGQIFARTTELKAQYPGLAVGLHLHNRNGMALANALAGLMAGVEWVEGSLLGLGGDAWFPGGAESLGNVPMEDLIHLTELLGVQTGVNLEEYLRLSVWAEELLGQRSQSYVRRGGTRSTLAAIRWEEVLREKGPGT